MPPLQISPTCGGRRGGGQARDTVNEHVFYEVIGYHIDRRVSTLWSIIVEYSHPNRCLITSYKEQARNPRCVALELTP